MPMNNKRCLMNTRGYTLDSNGFLTLLHEPCGVIILMPALQNNSRSSSMEQCNCQSNGCLIRAFAELAVTESVLRSSLPTSTLFHSSIRYLKSEMLARKSQCCKHEWEVMDDFGPVFCQLLQRPVAGQAPRTLSEMVETFKTSLQNFVGCLSQIQERNSSTSTESKRKAES